MNKKVIYTFKNIEQCNFCHSEENSFQVLGKRLNKSQGKNPKNKIGITTTIVKCCKCGLVFSNPLPIPQSLQDHYGIPPENYWKPEYFEIKDNYLAEEMRWLGKLMEIKVDMKALDIGAGLGKAMIIFERNGFEAYGLEPSKTFYKKAIDSMNIKKGRLQNLSIEEAQFNNNYFDFISFGVVLEHLYDPSYAISKALDWLKPGGLIHIEVPNSNWLINKMINKYYKLQGLDYVGNT